MQRFAALLVLLFTSTIASAQQPAFWRLEAIAKSNAPMVTLHKGPDKTRIGTLSTRRARMIVDVKTRLEKEAGVSAELVLTEGRTPNAFSTPVSKAGPMVGLNFGMLELLGDDRDAYAAVLGHEYAHLTLKHRESRMDRESLRRAGTVALAILLATQGVSYGAVDVANAATQAVSMTFSRDEERDADRTGLRYAAAAGFDPYGAVRTWERMATGGDKSVPFLSSHPASSERVENMRAFAAELASTTAAAEAEYLADGVKIHAVLFIESDAKIVVKEMPEDARSTLRAGDRLVGCHGGAAQELTMWSLSSCRSPSGAYAFVVERDAEQETAVLLRPHKP
jgi:predicted Zn-dependent protease